MTKFSSPRSNANLLSRSEVVALINTLHRFTESLHAVNDFRRMWRETNAADSAKLIKEAEKVANAWASFCSELVRYSFSNDPILTI